MVQPSRPGTPPLSYLLTHLLFPLLASLIPLTRASALPPSNHTPPSSPSSALLKRANDVIRIPFKIDEGRPYANIGLGKSNDKFKVLLDLGSKDSWVDLSGASADTFNNAHSLTPTGQDFTVNYFDDAVRVQGYGTTGDLRLIPTFVLSGSPIGVVNAVQDPSGILKVAQAKGLLGLGLPETGQWPLAKLAAAHVQFLMFDYKTQGTGVLSLGRSDKGDKSEGFVTQGVYRSGDQWVLPVPTVSFGGVDHRVNVRLVLDTGFALIRMRRDLVEEYYASVTPSQDVSPVPGNPLAWYVRCGMQLPAITFRVAAGEITIEGRRLYMRLVDSGKTGRCVGALAAHKDSSPLTPFVLGYPGFMAYQFRFRFATVDDQAFQGMTIGWRKNPFEDMDDSRSELL